MIIFYSLRLSKGIINLKLQSPKDQLEVSTKAAYNTGVTNIQVSD